MIRFVLIGLIGATLGHGACAPSSDAPTRDETLVISVRANVGPLDPAVAPGAEQAQILYPAYHNLVRIRVDRDTGADAFDPELATDWSVSDDRLRWTFQLAEDYQFSDGAQVTSEAVKFSIDRLLAIGRAPSSSLGAVIKSVETPDPQTVIFVLTKPVPSLLPLVADRSAFILNPTIMQHEVEGDWASAWLATNTAGSGAYELTYFSPRDVYIFDTNPYHPAPQTFKRLVFRTSTDTSIRALQLRRGDMDIGYALPAEALPQFEQDPDFQVQVVAIPAVNFLAFQLERPAVSDVRLRHAVALAIDYETIASGLKYGYAERWSGPLLPGMVGYVENSTEYDPDAARKIIAELQNEAPLPELEMIYPGVGSAADTLAVYIQSSLAEIGLQVKLQRITVPAMISRIQRGNFDMIFSGWVANYGDPSTFVNAWFDPEKIGAAGNYTRYCNDRVTTLLEMSLTEGDQTVRASQLREISEQVNRDIPYVYLVKNAFWIVNRSDIQGLNVDAYNLYDIAFHELDRISEERDEP